MSKLAEEVRQLMPAVVQIHARGHDEQDIQSILDPRFTVPMSWTGSGFFIRVDGESGYILTNSHVVRNASKLRVRSLLTSEEFFVAEPVGLVASGEPDVALVRLLPEEVQRFEKISGAPIPHVTMGDSNTVRRGLEIKAIGYPFGMPEPNVSGGEVTNFLSGNAAYPERLVTDAAINPGNSGGPAIIEGGQVVGINTSIIVNANNIGFITPINYARLLIPQFLSHQQVVLPGLTELGATLQPNSMGNAQFLAMQQPDGVVVTRVWPEGLLAKAGIQRFDVLLGINGHLFDRYGNVKSEDRHRKRNIFDVVRQIPVGEEIKISYLRKGQVKETKASTMGRPSLGVQSQPLIDRRRYLEFAGALIQELSTEVVLSLSQVLDMDYWAEVPDRQSDKKLLVVTVIEPDTEADDLLLSVGDLISHVGDQEVNTLGALVEAMAAAVEQGETKILLQNHQGDFGWFHLPSEVDLQIKSCMASDNGC